MVMSPREALKCPKCGSVMRWSDRDRLCAKCVKAQRELDRRADPNELVKNPTLAELDDELEKWYPR